MKDLKQLRGSVLMEAIKNEVASAPKGMQTAYFGFFLVRYAHKIGRGYTPDEIAHLCGMRPSYVIEVRKFQKINQMLREEGIL